MNFGPPIELAEKAIRGLHGAAFEAFTGAVSAQTRVVDLGGGSGAWASRLGEAGYDVTVVDRDRDFFRATHLPFVQADLNSDFANLLGRPGAESFQAVTSLEVIEHLENPRHFLRQVRRLLVPGGTLLLTTPNIECVAGRLRFLLRGNFRMFDRDPRFNDPTHITPIQSLMFERMLVETGFRVQAHGFNSHTPTNQSLLTRTASTFIGPLVRGVRGGDNHVFVLRVNSDEDTPQPP
jgi:2-polyprenyl-3-methyl-5-hydroxy-6-metoxy-1,4-benzoquinol methylase